MLHTEELKDKTKRFPGLNYQGIEGTVLATIINAKVLDVETLGNIEGVRTAPHVSLSKALSKKNKSHLYFRVQAIIPYLR